MEHTHRQQGQKIPILYFWADAADAQHLVHELAKTGTDFEVKLVRTQAEYVSALVKKRFVLVLADERAQTPDASAQDLSLFEIAEQISPGTAFALIGNPAGTSAESASFTTVARNDLNRLKDIINSALNYPG